MGVVPCAGHGLHRGVAKRALDSESREMVVEVPQAQVQETQVAGGHVAKSDLDKEPEVAPTQVQDTQVDAGTPSSSHQTIHYDHEGEEAPLTPTEKESDPCMQCKF